MSGGKDSDPVITGYRYFLGVQIALCHGPVDAVRRIVVGEREAWSGSVTSNSTISINKPNLFGGEGREGGVVGNVDIEMGEPSQLRNSYLQSRQNANCPAYRGLLTLIFKRFMWSTGNPYFKAPWVEITRIRAGWTRPLWNTGNAAIGLFDMNPVHIIYQCLTDLEWGLGYNDSDIDLSSFNSAAAAMNTEAFGMSLMWSSQTSIEAFIKEVLDHINGVLRLDEKTGKFTLKLIRGDYTIGSLVNINPSNILELKSLQRAAYGDFANEVVVNYTDRNQKTKSVAVQDLACIQAQGGVVSTTREYRGIRTASLASRVALRDLSTVSTPLAKLEVTTNRVLWDKNVGDVVSFSWPDYGIALAPYRIISIDKGTIRDGKIDVQLVEDIFGLPFTTYTETPASEWVDPISAAVPVEAARAVELPYWEVVRNTSRAVLDTLEPQYGFGSVITARGVTNAPFNFDLFASPTTSTADYKKVAVGHFAPTGLLGNALNRTQTNLTLTGFYDLEQAILENPDDGYLIIGNEAMAVVSVNVDTGVTVVRRGVLDTVPLTHAIGARVFFITPIVGIDKTERVSGETVYYRPLPVTGLGRLAIESATALPLTMQNRASRPYPPGQFRINSVYWPTNINGSVVVSWAHRDRLAQTVDLVDYSQASIGPEPGTSYTVRLYRDGTTLVRTIAGLSGTTFAYSAANEASDNYIQSLRITLTSVVDGIESLYPQDHTVERYGLGFKLGESLGGSIP